TWTMNSTSDHAFSMTTIATTANTRLAQSFQIANASQVDSVKLRLKKAGNPTGDLTLKLYTDSSGAPGSLMTDGTSAVVVASTLNTDYGWVTFTFLPKPTLSADTTYWLVLETSDAASAVNYVVWAADDQTPAYADGEMKSEQSGSWVAESRDARFEVFSPGTVFDEPLVVGRFSGGSRDIAVRYDNGSGLNPDTRTTFKNVTGASLDVTCVVELGG
ncbi:MAG: hypothetical protein K8I82_30740, partial [Anaerolineae bacterium]|nr:hypothetical protein [Anaerolineae bacterium]